MAKPEDLLNLGPPSFVLDTIPTSEIRSPGRLFENEKGRPTFYVYFQEIYEAFEVELSIEHSPCRATALSKDYKEKKTKNLIEIAQKLLSHYGIQSQLYVEDNQLQEALSLLNILLKEIFSFSKTFIQKFNIKALYINTDINQVPIADGSVRDKSIVFSLNEEEKGAILKLYKTMFMGLIKANQSIVEKWRVFRCKYFLGNYFDSEEDLQEDLERVFYSIMGCKKQTLLKQKIRKLERLLIKLNPECITMKELTRRKKRLKKYNSDQQHVSFDSSPTTNFEDSLSRRDTFS